MVNDATPAATAPARDWHLREAAALVREHEVDPAIGLTVGQVAKRSQRHGANELPQAGRNGLWPLVVDQFNDFMILVLIAAPLLDAGLRAALWARWARWCWPGCAAG